MDPRPQVFEMILNPATDKTVERARPSVVAVPHNWHADHQEGQLAVDVGETQECMVVVSTMAGAEAEHIEVYVHNDLLTIRGTRTSPLARLSVVEQYCSECFWGAFSRTIVLPVEVKGDLARAEYKHGVLTVTIPKRNAHMQVPVIVVDE